ncbi:hypothetical protein [Pyrobaculum aerophilum]|uniref:Uncharacterized protein n=1 Tax=Pyrobaculum aerophilum TaxID=13773 RepID=A0A371QYB5_9CREN|nr:MULTISPECIES: hypothetical protein [Pyrobaculum]RFA95699.1 hypothetical protein CGL52_12465 [Pyrobaculum aerophilum]
MKVKLIIIAVVIILFSLLAIYLYLSWGCRLEIDIKCFDTVPGEGDVWSPCSYDGDVKIEPEIPLNWAGDRFTCVAGGRVGNKTYVVLTRTVQVYSLTYTPFSYEDTGRCYCAKHPLDCIFRAETLPIYGARAVLVVDVNSGTGYLGIVYTYAPRYSDVVFGNDGVYLALRYVWVVREIAGDHISNCFYVVKVRLEREGLRLGQPINRTSGVFIKIPN